MEFSKPKKKLIIVHSKGEVKYANLLSALLSAQDDKEESTVGVKDNTVEAVVWTDKQYRDQKPQLANSDYVFFIGASKIIDEECFGLCNKYNECGMIYSELGKKCRCYISNINALTIKKEYDKVIAAYENGITIPRGKFEIINHFIAFGNVGLMALDLHHKATEYGYTTIILKAYLEFLSDFLSQ